MNHQRIAAIFDVDGTLITPTTLERIFIKFLWRRGQLGWRELLRWIAALPTVPLGKKAGPAGRPRLNAIKAYLRNLSHAGRLGDYLRIEDWLRWVLDSMKSDEDVSMLYGLFGSPAGRQLLQRTLLETPIIGMDSGFFALLRSLLGQHPRLYGSAVQAVWQRITARSRS